MIATLGGGFLATRRLLSLDAKSSTSWKLAATAVLSSIIAITASSNSNIIFPQISFAKLEKSKLSLQTSRRFIEKPGVQDEGVGGGEVAIWLNVILTPG